MGFWVAFGFLFAFGQLFCYAWCTPEKTPPPIRRTPIDHFLANSLYVMAYILSLLRLPFALLPYCIKLLGLLLFRKQYPVSRYHMGVEVLRIVGDVANWLVGVVIVGRLEAVSPVVKFVLCASVAAEAIRLFAEKGQMILSAVWQTLPHRRAAVWLSRTFNLHSQSSLLKRRMLRYCQYYTLDDEARMGYILNTLRRYVHGNADSSAKLAYLSALRIVPPSYGLRGGCVRDVARGEVFIHAAWTADPWLLMGQALRRAPWMFDPRYLRRPFHYRSESNRLATCFVFNHIRCCPSYALYQFGHEIKAARYDFFFRLLRGLGMDVEPKVQADGTFSFDIIISFLECKLAKRQPLPKSELWTDEAVIEDVRRRVEMGDNLSALDIALQYTYPLKYVEEVLINQSGVRSS